MDIVKCNKCGHVLISGNGCLALFSKGTKLGCIKCGNSYTFGEEPKELFSEWGGSLRAIIDGEPKNIADHLNETEKKL